MTASELAERAHEVADGAIDVREVPAEPEPGHQPDDDRAPAGELVPLADAGVLEERPLIPGHDELTVLAQLAVTFAQAGLVPKPLQQKPADVMLVLMTGRGLGIDPMVALRECHPIDGRVTVSPKLKLAIVRQRGLGRVWPDVDNDSEHARWFAERADDPGTVYAGSFTMDDAKRAGLTNKDNWKKYPAQMLQWRALGYLIDQAFGEVGTGLYSADELGAVTDDEGHAVIDVTEVAPLPGIEPKEKPPASNANDIAPEDEREAIRERIGRLPPPAVHVLSEAWAKQGPDGTPTLWPLKVLPNRQVKSAHALIDAIEKRAEKGEWGEWVGHDPAGSAPLGGTEAPPGEGDGPEGDESGEPTPESEPPSPEPGPVDDPEDLVCSAPDGCGEPVVIVSDEGDPWCEQHRPL